MEIQKCLLVTGASSGMGRALIRQVAGDYDTILAHYAHNDAPLRVLAESCGDKIHPVQADFSDESSVVRMIEDVRADGFVPTDIVHLAARPASFFKFSKYSWADYQAETEISLRSAVMILQAFLPAMAKAKDGKVIFMLTAFLAGADPKYMSPYITTKYALYGLLRTLSAEYEGKGICFGAVSPEMTDTDFVRNVPETVREIAAAASGAGKLLSPDCVADTLAQLLRSDGASFRHLYIDADGTTMDASMI